MQIEVRTTCPTAPQVQENNFKQFKNLKKKALLEEETIE